MKRIDLLGYSVRVQRGLAHGAGPLVRDVAPAHRYVVITDDGVEGFWLDTVVCALREEAGDSIVLSYTFPAGEHNKTRETWAAITDWMLDAGCGRDTTVVALGGGVVGDVAGFVAATFMRGVPIVQMPTTLLAMVDASVGGKTGVDTPAGKNLVGAFHQPAGVIIDPATLATLPPAHLRAGMAEVIKHGAIADEAYFERATEFALRMQIGLTHGGSWSWASSDAEEIIERSVDIKASVVSRDEREAGLRQILNAGHTVAHAVERASGFSGLHGEAVAIGLAIEARLAERAGMGVSGLAARVQRGLESAGLPTALPRGMDADAVLHAMERDKKARSGLPLFSLLADIGKPAGSEGKGWTTFLPNELVREVLLEAMTGPEDAAAAAARDR